MSRTDRIRAQQAADRLEEPVREAAALAETLGLEPYPVNYWVVDHDEMNQLIAYEGFQRRYPHWRWGMGYERQQKQGQFLGGKAFEIVNNDDPAHAFLQESNALADQKAVITHVEAHADFFANNEWFGLFTDGNRGEGSHRRSPNASAMLARHADTVEEYMSDPEIGRAAVEEWIDHVLCIEEAIDQHSPYAPIADAEDGLDVDVDELPEQLEDLALTDEVREQVFDSDWLEAQTDEDGAASFPAEPKADVLAFLARHGKQYDDEAGKAVEMEEWQREVLEIVRREAYYFAPQRMTKVMNEGWASFWESRMMADEGFADADEFVLYADHMSKVLGSGGLNPYRLGLELWTYVENTENRREVVERLLRTEGITPRTFHDAVDFGLVQDLIAPDPEFVNVPAHLESLDPDDPRVDGESLEMAREGERSEPSERASGSEHREGHANRDGEIDVERYPWKVLTYEGMAERHYSLCRPQHRGFVSRVGRSELERLSRYMFDDDRYGSIEEALADLDYARGWDRMREIRESHNDVTFIDEFLTQEFVDDNDYFAYEHSRTSEHFRVSSTDDADVKKKLLLEFTNFGTPTITVEDGNYENRNELLLGHRYNGVVLDVEQATSVLERLFELWGRPVNLLTIDKVYDDHDVEVARRRDREPDPEEVGKRLRYDGEEITVAEVAWEAVEHLAADDVDYDTKPEEWLG